ncbi:WXG100 family type VII secretion target [Microbacterium karelineae]|uniref:WXG100 family type VII secretion target n=1 Tax=Microbacterium karelineae TaxID=2654283 RepID=UPI0012EA727F|nr:hypothetical protein [Microbacterium karelineae]
MVDQHADTTDLNALVQSLTELVTYCEALKSGASGFAYMLPNDWQGPAMSAFLGAFNTWALGADAMVQQAEALRKQADAAHKAYDGAIGDMDTYWSSLEGSLGD